MLRTPRARLSAIKYLDKKIPKNLKIAIEKRDKGLKEDGRNREIYVSEYTIKIVNREVQLNKDLKRKAKEDERLNNM